MKRDSFGPVKRLWPQAPFKWLISSLFHLIFSLTFISLNYFFINYFILENKLIHSINVMKLSVNDKQLKFQSIKSQLKKERRRVNEMN